MGRIPRYRRRRAGEAVHVVELEEGGRCATAAVSVEEGAPAAVALIDEALRGVRDVARRRRRDILSRFPNRSITWRSVRRRRRGVSLGPLPPADRKALLLHLRDQQIESLLEDGRHVAVRQAMPEQVLGLPQLVAKCPAGG